MEQKTQAIILKTREVGEADQVVSFFSKDYGRLTLKAPKAKRSKRRFLGMLESFSEHEIVFQERRAGWPQLLRLETIATRTKFREDLGAFSAASYAAELFLRLTQERDANLGLFQLLSAFLDMLLERPLHAKALCRFYIRLLHDLGFSPDWEYCFSCGLPSHSEESFRFDPSEGTLTCSRCLTPEQRSTRAAKKDLIDLLLRIQNKQALEETSKELWKRALKLLELRIDFLLSGNPRSRKFFYDMNNENLF